MGSWRALEISGKDSKDFLQRLTTVNLRKVEPGHGTWGLLLEASSKIIGAFALLLPQKDDYYLVFACKEEMERVQSALERLHFSESLEIRGIPGAGGILAEEGNTASPHGEVFSVLSGAGNLTWPSRLRGRTEAFSEKMLDFVDEDNFEKARILAGLPKWGAEYGAESNALDVGLGGWIHEGKGCYPGQEVVERSLRVGHPARALVKIEASTTARVGEPLLADGKEVGKVTSAHGNFALAIVQWKYREADGFARSSEGVFRCRK